MKKRNSTRKTKQNNNRLGSDYVPYPPMYSPTTQTTKIWRFINYHTGDEGTQTYSISPAKVCALQGIGAVVNSQAVQIFESAKIKKIRLWASPPGDGNVVHARVEFPGTIGGIIGNNYSKADQSSGMTHPAYISIKPPRLSQAADWQNGDITSSVATSEWFRIVISSTSGVATTVNIFTLDLHCTMRVSTDARLIAAAGITGLTTVAVGSLYYFALDNPCGGTLSMTNNWPPIGLVTTT